MRTCEIDDCDRPLKCRGMCSLHYERARREIPQERQRAARIHLESEQKPTTWDTPAACAQLPTAEQERIFWPSGYDTPTFDIRQFDEAIGFCKHECAAKDICLQDALDNRRTHRTTGILGGTTPGMRAKLVTKINKQKAAA